jgi:hypothetical protein
MHWLLTTNGQSNLDAANISAFSNCFVNASCSATHAAKHFFNAVRALIVLRLATNRTIDERMHTRDKGDLIARPLDFNAGLHAGFTSGGAGSNNNLEQQHKRSQRQTPCTSCHVIHVLLGC